MSGEAADAEDNRPPAPEFQGPSLLALIRPSILASIAMVISLGLSGTWPPANQLVLHRSVDLLVLAIYLWQLIRHRSGFFEVCGISVTAAGFMFLVFKGAWLMPVIILIMAVFWLLLTWTARRWPMQRGLAVLALFWVVLRLAVVAMRAGGHGSADAAWPGVADVLFLVLLVVISFTSSSVWRERSFAVPPVMLFQAGLSGVLLLAATVAMQWQKASPHDALSSGTGRAGFGNLALALLAAAMAWSARRWTWGRLRWLPPALAVLPLNQVVLGLYSKYSSNAFVSGFYQVNELLVLALVSLWVCLVAAELWRQSRPETAGSP